MAKANDNKRLREIEIQLTPTQWAVGFAKQMRQHSSEKEFLKKLGRGTHAFRELPFVKPFFALSEQAKTSHPRKNAHDVEAKNHLSQRLRKEFQFLKLLIKVVNACSQEKSSAFKLRTAFALSRLDGMITRTILERNTKRLASCIEKHGPDFRDAELTEVLSDLVACTSNSDDTVDTPCLPARTSSSIEDSTDDLAMLVNEVFTHKAAIKKIQEEYFEGHPILWRDNEAALELATQSILNAVAIFNEYLNKSFDLFVQETNKAPCIDVERIREFSGFLAGAIASQWVTEANDRASIEILQESGDHEEFILELLRNLSKPKFSPEN